MRTKKRLLSFALVLALLVGMMGAAVSPAYAVTPPEIGYSEYDHWLWPGEDITVGIALRSGVDRVELHYRDEGTGSWQWGGELAYTDSERTIWTIHITDPFNGGQGFRMYRFMVYYGGAGPLESRSFFIKWTGDQGYERIYGDNRYKTAIEIAKVKLGLTSATKYDNVVIASGMDFADALGGTYLAAVKHAPILLVNSHPQVIQDVAGHVVSNLNPYGMIYILGGEGAVSKDMELALKAGGVPESRIKRFDGANRYETNLKILNYCNPSGGDVLVCSGLDFADALSASATGLPILLVGSSLTEGQATFLNHAAPDYVNIIGGNAAVSAAVESQIRDLGMMGYRLAGKDRYDTSLKVAANYFSDRQRQYVTLAYGLDFPDGLAGGPLSFEIGAPMLLVANGHVDYAKQFISGNGCRRAKVLGGPAIIAGKLVEDVLQIKGVG